MIKGFGDKKTAQIWEGKRPKGISADLAKRARVKLSIIHFAASLEDLAVPPGNRLEALAGDRLGQYSIRINRQYRVCFRWENGDAFDVEMTDYH